MTTYKQKAALVKMVENGGNVSQAMISVGYSTNTAKTPKKLTNSRGFKEVCEEVGLTNNFLLNCLVEDIKKKRGNRKSEIELGFKLLGTLLKVENENNLAPNFGLFNLASLRKKYVDD